jgi:glycerol-3-phosphate dehydrogenase
MESEFLGGTCLGLRNYPETARHLSHKFSAAAREVLDLTKDNPQFKEPIVDGPFYIQSEVVYCIREEVVTSIEDMVALRTGLQFFS